MSGDLSGASNPEASGELGTIIFLVYLVVFLDFR